MNTTALRTFADLFGRKEGALEEDKLLRSIKSFVEKEGLILGARPAEIKSKPILASLSSPEGLLLFEKKVENVRELLKLVLNAVVDLCAFEEGPPRPSLEELRKYKCISPCLVCDIFSKLSDFALTNYDWRYYANLPHALLDTASCYLSRDFSLEEFLDLLTEKKNEEEIEKLRANKVTSKLFPTIKSFLIQTALSRFRLRLDEVHRARRGKLDWFFKPKGRESKKELSPTYLGSLVSEMIALSMSRPVKLSERKEALKDIMKGVLGQIVDAYFDTMKATLDMLSNGKEFHLYDSDSIVSFIKKMRELERKGTEDIYMTEIIREIGLVRRGTLVYDLRDMLAWAFVWNEVFKNKLGESPLEFMDDYNHLKLFSDLKVMR